MTHISELKRILKANFPWHQQRIDTLGRLVLALIKVRNVNLTELACAFGGKATRQSTYRRLQRFFADYAFSLDEVACFIYGLFFSQCGSVLEHGPHELEVGSGEYQYPDVVGGVQRGRYPFAMDGAQ